MVLQVVFLQAAIGESGRSAARNGGAGCILPGRRIRWAEKPRPPGAIEMGGGPVPPFCVDAPPKVSNNIYMSIEQTIPAELLLDLEQVLGRAMTGIRDPEEMRKAREEMNRMREETRQRIGIVNIAVDLVRDARNP
jgi:hypothetical protein